MTTNPSTIPNTSAPFDRERFMQDDSGLPASPATPADGEWVVVKRESVQEAIDLLAERRHGSPARSPGHNARLALERLLSASPVQPVPVETGEQ